MKFLPSLFRFLSNFHLFKNHASPSPKVQMQFIERSYDELDQLYTIHCNFLKSINQPLPLTSQTGIPVVDTTINTRALFVSAQNISCDWDIDFPHHSGISDMDIYLLLRTLLDFAIDEAQKNDSNKEMKVTIRKINFFIFVQIHFSSQNANVISSPECDFCIVSDILKKYNGSFKTYSSGNLCTIELMLSMPRESVH